MRGRRSTKTKAAGPSDAAYEPDTPITFDGARLARALEGLPDSASIFLAAEILFALADPARVKIVLALSAADELCVSDIAQLLHGRLSNASVHLRRLREARIVTRRGDGKLSYYSLRRRDPSVKVVQLVIERARALANEPLVDG